MFQQFLRLSVALTFSSAVDMSVLGICENSMHEHDPMAIYISLFCTCG